MDSGICGEIGADTTVLSNGSLTGVINDGYSFGNTALAKGGIHGGKGNLATKSITEPLKFATNAGAVSFIKLSDTIKCLPSLSQFQVISQSH